MTRTRRDPKPEHQLESVSAGPGTATPASSSPGRAGRTDAHPLALAGPAGSAPISKAGQLDLAARGPARRPPPDRRRRRQLHRQPPTSATDSHHPPPALPAPTNLPTPACCTFGRSTNGAVTAAVRDRWLPRPAKTKRRRSVGWQLGRRRREYHHRAVVSSSTTAHRRLPTADAASGPLSTTRNPRAGDMLSTLRSHG